MKNNISELFYCLIYARQAFYNFHSMLPIRDVTSGISFDVGIVLLFCSVSVSELGYETCSVRKSPFPKRLLLKR
jgi:hypothetical protein